LAKRRGRGKFLLLVFMILIVYLGYKKTPELIKVFYPYNYKQTIVEHSQKYNLDPKLVATVIKAESNFYVFAKSKKGALGLMQITPATGEWISKKLGYEKFDEEMLYNPETNIKFGCWYIDYLSKHYNYNLKYVFSAYNGGEGNVDKWIENGTIDGDISNVEDIPYPETKKYVQKIRTNYKIYKALYE